MQIKLGEGSNVKKKKLIEYALITFVLIMVFFTYTTYKENQYLKSRMGTEYENLVIQSLIFLKEESSTDYWLEQMKSPRGNEALHSLISELSFLSSSLHKHNLDYIALQMDVLKRQFYNFMKYENEFSLEEIKELEQNVSILASILTTVKSDLENDSLKWYKEIHNHSSKTQEYIRSELTSYWNEKEVEIDTTYK